MNSPSLRTPSATIPNKTPVMNQLNNLSGRAYGAASAVPSGEMAMTAVAAYLFCR